jgi:hypothetical protein
MGEFQCNKGERILQKCTVAVHDGTVFSVGQQDKDLTVKTATFLELSVRAFLLNNSLVFLSFLSYILMCPWRLTSKYHETLYRSILSKKNQSCIFKTQ